MKVVRRVPTPSPPVYHPSTESQHQTPNGRQVKHPFQEGRTGGAVEVENRAPTPAVGNGGRTENAVALDASRTAATITHHLKTLESFSLQVA